MAFRVSLRAACCVVLVAGHSYAASVPPEHAPAGAGASITLALDSVTLPAALKHWSDLTGIGLQVFWRDQAGEGLDAGRLVTLRVTGGAADVLEALLRDADDGEGGGATRQRGDAAGTWQVGPRSRLNAHRRLAVYDVADLVAAIPDFRDGPTIDLEAALSRSGSPFRDAEPVASFERADEDDRVHELMELIVAVVEPDQWVSGGGAAASIHRYGARLVIHAPGYIHRQVGGPLR